MPTLDEEFDALPSASAAGLDAELDALDAEFDALPTSEEASAERESVLRTVFEKSAGAAPEAEAKVLSIANRTGVPARVVEKKPDDFQAMWEAGQFDIAAWSRENPELASVAAEDVRLGGVVMRDRQLAELVKVMRRKEVMRQWLSERREADYEWWNQQANGLGDALRVGDQVTGAYRWLMAGAPMGLAPEDPLVESAGMGGLPVLPEDRPELERRMAAATAPQRTLMRDVSAEAPGTLAQTRSAFVAGDAQVELSRLGFELLVAEGRGADTTELRQRIEEQRLATLPRYYGEQSELQRTLTAGGEMLPSTLQTYLGGGVGGALGLAGGAVLGAAATRSPVGVGAGARAGMALGIKAGASAAALELEAGSTYLESEGWRTDDGRTLSKEERAAAAVLYGMASAVIETASFGATAKSFGPLGEAIVNGEGRAFLSRAVRDRGFRAILKQAGKGYLESVGTEALEESAQSLAESATEYLARRAPAGMTLRGEAEKAVEAGEMALRAGLVTGGVGPSVALLTKSYSLARARVAGERAAALAQLADSPTVKAAPERVARIIQEATEKTGQPVPAVYVDSGEFVRYFQEGKAEPAQAAAELIGPDGPRLLQEAVATGAPLEVPLATYLERWGPTEAAKALAEHTTTEADALTPKLLGEMEEQVGKRADELVKQFDELDQAAKEKEPLAVKDRGFVGELRQMLVEVGVYDKQQARRAVALLAAFVETQTARFGKSDPSEILGHVRLMIQGRPAAPESGAESFEFGENVGGLKAQADAFVERMRDPEKKAIARAFFAYATAPEESRGERPKGVSTEIERDLARFGVVDPVHGFELSQVDELGAARIDKDLRRSRTKGEAEPLALREYRLRRAGQWQGYDAERGYSPFKPVRLFQESQKELETLAKPSELAEERGAVGLLRKDFADAAPREQSRKYFTDGVTGLLNERGFERLGVVGPVVVVRAGGIKAVNDSYSHADADAYLQEVARVVAAHNPSAARVGGDFVVPTDEAGATKLRDALAAAPALQGMPIATAFGQGADAAKQALTSEIERRKAAPEGDAGRWPKRGELPGVLQGKRKVPFESGKATAKLPMQTLPSDVDVGAAFDTVYREKDTGALTKDGFERLQELQPKKHVMSMDLNGLRLIHEELERAFGLTKEQARAYGDKLILAFTRGAMEEAGGAAFDFAHFSGDEYMARSDDPKALAEFGRLLEAGVASLAVIDDDPSGNGVITYGGFGFGRGIGTDRQLADRALNKHKERLTREGRRGDEAQQLRRHATREEAEAEAAARDLHVRQAGVDEGRGSAQPQEEGAAKVERVFAGEDQPGGPRGYTEFERRAGELFATVGFTERADLSTFLHETGHIFLEIFGDLAARPDAPRRVQEDYAAALKYIGVERREDIQREHNERWARAFETYLMEGRAPSEKLVGAFERFKLWLKQIYRSLAALDAPLDDDIRGVFDRLLATDDEISRARNRMGLQPMFRTAEDAGMSPEQWQKYLEEQEEATAHARRQAEHRAMKDRLRENLQWLKDEEKRLRPELERLRSKLEPQYDALPAKLSKDALQAANADPDGIADLHGFATVADMQSAVEALPEKREWAEQEARRQMLEEKYPDVLADRAILQAEVAKGLHGDFTQKWLLRELEILRKRMNDQASTFYGFPSDRLGRRVPVEAAKRAAQRIVERRTIGKLNPWTAMQRERSAADNAVRAAAKGDFAQAYVLKQQQLLNFHIYKMLDAARDEREAFLGLAGELAKEPARKRLGKARQAYLGGVDLMLETLGLKEPVSREEPLPSIAEVVSTMVQDGNSITFDEQQLVAIFASGRAWRELTVAEMREVDRALRGIRAAARTRTTALVEGKRLERDEVIAAMVAEATKLRGKGPVSPSRESMTLLERAGGLANKLDGDLLRPAVMIEDMVGEDLSSMWHRAVILPLRAAKQREADLLKTTIKPIVDAFEKVPAAVRRRFMEKIDGQALFPDHRKDMEPPRRRFELLMMGLHVGNESNLTRLLEGRGITVDQVRAALDMLTADEVTWLQSVMDAAESLWPEAKALEERDAGVAPPKIEHKPFSIAGGTLSGYFPAAYDSRVEAAGMRREGAELGALFDPSYTRPGTARSHLRNRVEGFTGALTLSPAMIYSHLSQVAHDIAFRETLKSVGGLILDERIQATLRDQLGDEKRRFFLPWLKDIGQQRGQMQSQLRGFDALVRWMRGNMAPAILGWSASTAIGDFANLAAAIPATQLKTRYLAAGLGEFVMRPWASRTLALEKSAELRSHEGELTREFSRQVKSLTTRGPFARGPLAWWKDYAFTFMEWSQAATSTPIWLGAYRQALSDGKNEQAAVLFADDVLNKAVPSHSVVDQAAILRDKGFWGMATVFYGYLSTAYAQQHRIIRPFIQAQGRLAKLQTLPKVAGGLFAFYVAYNVLGELLMGRGPEDDEEWSQWFLRKLIAAPLNLFPLELGQRVEAGLTGKRQAPRTSPVSHYIETFGRNALQAIDGDEEAGKRVIAAAQAIALTFGIPYRQPIKTGGYLEGDLEPRGPADVVGGLIYGEREGQPDNPATLIQDIVSGDRR